MRISFWDSSIKSESMRLELAFSFVEKKSHSSISYQFSYCFVCHLIPQFQKKVNHIPKGNSNQTQKKVVHLSGNIIYGIRKLSLTEFNVSRAKEMYCVYVVCIDLKI